MVYLIMYQERKHKNRLNIVFTDKTFWWYESHAQAPLAGVLWLFPNRFTNTCAFCKPPTNNGDFSVSDGPCPTNASFSGHTPGAGTHRGRLSKPRLVPRLQVVATNKLPPPVHILKVPCYVIRRFWRTSLTKKKSAICWDMYQELCFIEVVRTSLCLWNDS